MLSWIAVHVEVDRIEHDLELRSRSALDRAGYDWASIVFSGRDGMVVGTAPSRADVRAAVALVRRQWGVRVVESRIRLPDQARLAQPIVPERKPEPTHDGKRALPPLTSSVAVLAPAEARIVASPIVPAISSAAPQSLAEPGPDPVPTLEQDQAQERVIVTKAAADAEMTQDAPQGAALETAALATATSAAIAEACSAAVRAVNFDEPVRFAIGESDLNDHSRGVLDRFAATAGTCPKVGLKVLGHTDARGNAKRNLALSRRRARAVVTYLIHKGIDAGRLEAVGYGETRPVAPNDTWKNMAKNRRIELEMTGVGPTP